MSVQNYETDVLQEHVDSTPVLVARLDQWRHSIHVVQQYVQGYYAVHQSVSANLEKTLKQINDIPTFSGLTQKADNGGETQLANVFRSMQSNANVLLQRSIATTNSIKSSVLPPLEDISVEIEKHYKTLRTQGTRGIKDIEKSREHTQKLIEHLGQVTSSYGTRSLSPHDDPFILHRKVEAAVAEQVARENTQAEAALNVQQSFSALEGHIMQTIRHTLANLASLNEGFDKSEFEVNSAITNMFKEIDMQKEWTIFTKSNSKSLVPSKNYQRDPRLVTFVNKTHPSTKPVLQGLLNRKGTVLKSYNQGYYVISPTGYMYQFKSAEPTLETSPEMSLYLPGCQVSKSSKVGQFVFKVVGKDTQKAISTRHKFVFRTNSQRELETWYNAVARMTGNEGAVDEDSGENDTPSDTPIQSPVEPPVSQMGQTSLDAPPQQPPQPQQRYVSQPQSPAVQHQAQFQQQPSQAQQAAQAAQSAATAQQAQPVQQPPSPMVDLATPHPATTETQIHPNAVPLEQQPSATAHYAEAPVAQPAEYRPAPPVLSAETPAPTQHQRVPSGGPSQQTHFAEQGSAAPAGGTYGSLTRDDASASDPFRGF